MTLAEHRKLAGSLIATIVTAGVQLLTVGISVRAVGITALGGLAGAALVYFGVNEPSADGETVPTGAEQMVVKLLPETSSDVGRLGRNVEHDPRSRSYTATPPALPLVSKRWARRSPVFDQGDIGACPGNAAAGWAATDNAARPGARKLTEGTARKVYSLATTLDTIPGQWKPDDTGSSGLAAAKALVELKRATKFTHCFDLPTVLATLSHVGPVMIGIEWKTGCDTPDKTGLIAWSGTVRGGHEILLDEIDVENQLVWIQNSWGKAWGVPGITPTAGPVSYQGGRAYLTWADLASALKAQGDATVPA